MRIPDSGKKVSLYTARCTLQGFLRTQCEGHIYVPSQIEWCESALFCSAFGVHPVR